VLQRLVSFISVILNIFLLVDGCYYPIRFWSLHSFCLFIAWELALIVLITVADCGESQTACKLWITAMCLQLLFFLEVALTQFPDYVIDDLRWHGFTVEKEFVVIMIVVILYILLIGMLVRRSSPTIASSLHEIGLIA
ncbi:hypothetical protein PENTCL1PPCAC_4444, partial [Pristionchus entomophagus]